MESENWEALYKSTLYAISHDFSAPLRHVEAFAELLLENNQTLDEESKTWIEHVHNAGANSRAMLAAFLRLSRVYSEPAPTGIMCVNELAAQLTCDSIDGGDKLKVDVSASQLSEALLELTKNVASYGIYEGTKISYQNETIDIVVLDSGPGISEQDWPTAIQPFKRLGRRPEVNSIGIGLPMAAAISGQMGGRLINSSQGVSIHIPLT